MMPLALGVRQNPGKSTRCWLLVNMSEDVNSYCCQCATHQAAKLATSTPAPLANILIGHPWRMVAVDSLEVSM